MRTALSINEGPVHQAFVATSHGGSDQINSSNQSGANHGGHGKNNKGGKGRYNNRNNNNRLNQSEAKSMPYCSVFRDSVVSLLNTVGTSTSTTHSLSAGNNSSEGIC